MRQAYTATSDVHALYLILPIEVFDRQDALLSACMQTKD